MFNHTATNFNQYFWTPYSFVVLILVALLECFLVFKFLTARVSAISFKYTVLSVLIANLVSFFMEYYLSVFLNAGHRILVWIPWVKLISDSEKTLYFISFPIIFVFTILSESIVAAVLLKQRYQWKQMLQAVFFTNLISTAILIVVFNFVLFNVIKGEDEGYWDDLLLPIGKHK